MQYYVMLTVEKNDHKFSVRTDATDGERELGDVVSHLVIGHGCRVTVENTEEGPFTHIDDLYDAILGVIS